MSRHPRERGDLARRRVAGWDIHISPLKGASKDSNVCRITISVVERKRFVV
jgi:hypothetical protein